MYSCSFYCCSNTQLLLDFVWFLWIPLLHRLPRTQYSVIAYSSCCSVGCSSPIVSTAENSSLKFPTIFHHWKCVKSKKKPKNPRKTDCNRVCRTLYASSINFMIIQETIEYPCPGEPPLYSAIVVSLLLLCLCWITALEFKIPKIRTFFFLYVLEY